MNLAVASGLLLSACSGTGAERSPDGRVVHRGGEGPLQVAASGGNSIRAPKAAPWTATFGWADPCTTTGEHITIEAIRHRFEVEPESIRSVIFEGRRWSGVTGIGSMKGTPREALRKDEVRGKLLGPAEGYVVTKPCDDSDPERSLQILTVLDVGERGAEITDYAIDYSTGDEKYTLEVDYQMVACGTQTSPDMC